MERSSKYIHKIQRVDAPGFAVLDIEENFPGLKYKEASGMYDIGNAKNIYTEEYADSDKVRVYLPSVIENGGFVHRTNMIANESTEIKMTFVVIGDVETRLSIISEFEDEIRTGVHRYWDSGRKRMFDFIVTDKIEISDEKWYGSQPYVEITVKMHNINGKTRHVEPSAIIWTRTS